MGYYFGMKRAQEEIIRLNVKINHLLTFMVNSHVDYYHAIQANIVQNPPLAHILSLEWQHQDRIHKSIMQRLAETSKLPGFTGMLSFGVHVNHDKALNMGIPLPSWMLVENPVDTVHMTQNMNIDGRRASSVENDNDLDIPQELDVGTDALVEFIDRISSSD